MCGIAGIFDLSCNPDQTRQDVAAMIETLIHRGPDDGHIVYDDGWALGARRLAIQDLSRAGRQPMTRGDLTIAYNGEVYNFRELRRELETDRVGFASGCDTEVVLAAFQRWGAAAFQRFNGMFALAIVDRRKRRAWLARDRWGKKPLFIARLGDRVAVASELKAIIAVAAQNLSIDRRALAHYFRYQYVPTDESIFRQVEKLMPASWLELDLDSLSTTRGSFWDLPQPSRDSLPAARPVEVLEAVRQSVRRRLVADVPVGAFLSGGTDSSLVVACMKEADADCRTFSIGFDDPRYDESRYALAVAEHLGTNHTHRMLTQQDALELIPQLPAIYDEPFADSSALPQLLVSRVARSEVTVVLSGDGGDELFGGYLRYRLAPYLSPVSRLPRFLRVAALLGAHVPVVGRRLRLIAEIAAAESPGAAYRELMAVWKTPDLRRLVPDVDLSDNFAETFNSQPGGSVARMMRTDARTYLMDDILQKVDRATMAVSLEGRNPLLDPVVAELGLRSTEVVEGAPGGKPLLRSTLALVLPQRLVDRPKMGFGVPVGDWMRNELRPLVEDLVVASSATEYDTTVAKKLCRDHLDGRREVAHQLWALLSFELWRNRWLASGRPTARPLGRAPREQLHSHERAAPSTWA